ncbi:MAG: zinc ribbon domain-containing protein [Ruminococcaceae bacterium]|nr:zinc ribbon domain-containing protein [Oscillospiraceae bacterium]
MKFFKAVGWWSLYALIAIIMWFFLFFIFGILGSFYYDGENSTAGTIYTITMLIFPVAGSSLCAVAFSKFVPKKLPTEAKKESRQNVEPVPTCNSTDAPPQQNNLEPRSATSIPTFPSALFCCRCGAQSKPNRSFCTNCGSPLPTTVPHSSVPQTVQHFSPEPVYVPVQPQNIRFCPRCNSHNLQYQTVTEDAGAGCFTVLLYILLAITILGLFIVIPLAMRKSTNTVTYEICQSCGHRRRV